MANYCIYCGAPLPEGAGECPQCGREVTDLGMGPAASPQPAELMPHGEQEALPAAAQDAAPSPQPELVLNDDEEPVLGGKAVPAGEPAQPQTPEGPPQPTAGALDPLNDTILLGGSAPRPDGGPSAPRPPVTPHYQPVGGPRQPRRQGEGDGPAYARGALPLGGQPAQELTLGTAVGMLLVSLIPIVSWVLLVIWSFDHGEAPSRRNLARALLIFKGVQLVLLGIGLGLLRGLLYFAQEILYNFRYFY